MFIFIGSKMFSHADFAIRVGRGMWIWGWAGVWGGGVVWEVAGRGGRATLIAADVFLCFSFFVCVLPQTFFLFVLDT